MGAAGARAPNADVAGAGLDPNAEFVFVPAAPNAEGCPKTDPVGAVLVDPEPNADGCVPANAEKPAPAPPLEGALEEPNALGPALANAANAPPVAGLISDDAGVLVWPKAEVVVAGAPKALVVLAGALPKAEG